MFQSYNTVCLPLLLIPALLVSLVKIISWIASRQRRSSHSAVPSDTFSSAKVNLLTGKVPGQTLQTGLINRNLAVLKCEQSQYNCNAFCGLLPEENMQIWWYYWVIVRYFLSFVNRRLVEHLTCVYLISMSHIKMNVCRKLAQTSILNYIYLFIYKNLENPNPTLY